MVAQARARAVCSDRNSVTGLAGAVEFALELRNSSRIYYALLTVDSDYWSDFDESTRAAAQVLIDLNLEQYRPGALAALSTFARDEIPRFMNSMVSWTVRGGRPPCRLRRVGIR